MLMSEDGSFLAGHGIPPCDDFDKRGAHEYLVWLGVIPAGPKARA